VIKWVRDNSMSSSSGDEVVYSGAGGVPVPVPVPTAVPDVDILKLYNAYLEKKVKNYPKTGEMKLSTRSTKASMKPKIDLMIMSHALRRLFPKVDPAAKSADKSDEEESEDESEGRGRV
jgi:hypothetical protein